MKIEDKIYSWVDLNRLKKENEKKIVVFTNGCFDILHKGHIDYLSKAKDLGDFLIVGINSDSSVKLLKGESRPINPEDARVGIVASLFFVDAVIVFNDETPLKLIETIIPDVLVKGGDYVAEEIVGYSVVAKNGGKTITIDLTKGYSTTKIIKQL